MTEEDALIRALVAVPAPTREALILLHREIESHKALAAHDGIDARVSVLEADAARLLDLENRRALVNEIKRKEMAAILGFVSVVSGLIGGVIGEALRIFR